MGEAHKAPALCELLLVGENDFEGEQGLKLALLQRGKTLG